MHKEKINRVNAGIAALLALILAVGILCEFVFADDVCGGMSGIGEALIGGYVINASGDVIEGVNVTLYINNEYFNSSITSSDGVYLFHGMPLHSNPAPVRLTAAKNGTSTNRTFNIYCGDHLDKYLTMGIEKPDLLVNPSEISFSPGSPAEFQSTTITATIHNIGNANAGLKGAADVSVFFYKDNLNNFIGNDTIELPASSLNTASINWMAEFGNHTIIVIANADSKIQETNENNNRANKTINIPKADIYLNLSDMFFDPESSLDLQKVKITATIHMSGISTVNFNVSFYEGNSLIGNRTVIFTGMSSVNTSVIWNPTDYSVSYGNRDIKVVADSNKEINEFNEDNNQANKTINIITTNDFINQDKVVFKYLYANASEKSLIYLPELETIFGDRILIERSCPSGNCGISALGEFFNGWYSICSKHGYSTIPLTMSIGKKSMNATGGIDYDKVNYTEDFNETDNKTLNQWIKNICYQFEVKPDVCLPCDLNHDGVVIKDYGELMAEYKCFLGISSNCRDLDGDGITFQDWREMKHEYECFNGLA